MINGSSTCGFTTGNIVDCFIEDRNLLSVIYLGSYTSSVLAKNTIGCFLLCLIRLINLMCHSLVHLQEWSLLLRLYIQYSTVANLPRNPLYVIANSDTTKKTVKYPTITGDMAIFPATAATTITSANNTVGRRTRG